MGLDQTSWFLPEAVRVFWLYHLWPRNPFLSQWRSSSWTLIFRGVIITSWSAYQLPATAVFLLKELWWGISSDVCRREGLLRSLYGHRHCCIMWLSRKVKFTCKKSSYFLWWELSMLWEKKKKESCHFKAGNGLVALSLTVASISKSPLGHF